MKKLQTLIVITLLPLCLFGQGTFTQITNMGCGDSVQLGPLGYPFWNPPQIVEHAQFGNATTDSLNVLTYQSVPYYAGTDTVIVACASATQLTCDTGIYIFNVSCATPANEFFSNNVLCGDTICIDNLSGFGAPSIAVGSTHGSASIYIAPTDGAGLCYTPDSDFEGTDFVLVKHFNLLRLYVFQVGCSPVGVSSGPKVYPVKVWPSPSAGLVNISTSEKPEQVLLTNASGISQVIDFQDHGDQIQVDLSRFPAGVYWVRVQDRNRVGVAKIYRF